MKKFFLILCSCFIIASAACAPKHTGSEEPAPQAEGTQKKPEASEQKPDKVMPGDVKPIKSQADFDDAMKRAGAGDAAASASLALYYYNQGEPLDINAAGINAKTAAVAGVVEGKYVLAELFLMRRDDNDAKTGLTLAQEASEAGYVPAVTTLGKYYYMGRVVPRDLNQARTLFERAAEQNDPGGQYFLGVMYATGAGVSEDQAKAADYFKKAAAQGLPIAQFALADQYAKGKGVEKNIDEAIRLYRGPANAGNVLAQVELAFVLLDSGKDQAEGIAWLKKASDQGFPVAKFVLANCYFKGIGVQKSEPEAFKLAKEAAEAGMPKAQGFLGELYYHGVGTGQDYVQSAKWFKEAAAWGDTVAMYRLASMYYEGHGVKKDKSEAYYWAVLAEALEPVDETHAMRTGIGGELSEQQRKSVEKKAQNWRPKTMPI